MISKKAQSLIPYKAGEQPRGGFIKLNTNENPYPPSVAVLDALKEADLSRLRLYPDPDSRSLTEAVAAYEKVKPENIFLGNGSDEVLAFAFLALMESSAAFFDVTYSFYPVYCDLYNLKKITVPLSEDFTADLNAFKPLNAGGIVLANPNAPTSLSVPSAEILKLAAAVPCNVIVDEAYIDFARNTESLASAAPELPNVLVVKTFSKSYSLAGLRCGYAVGAKELIDGLNRVKNCVNSYTLDMLCQAAAKAAVCDRAYFNDTCAKIIATRAATSVALKKEGHTVLDSDANFLFARHKSLGGAEVYRQLKEKGVLVRFFDSARTAPFVRVTIGTDDEMGVFLKHFNALK